MTTRTKNPNLNLLLDCLLDWNHDLLANRSYPVRIIAMAIVLRVTTAGAPLPLEPNLNLEGLVDLPSQLSDPGKLSRCLGFMDHLLERDLLIAILPKQDLKLERFWGFFIDNLEINPNLGSRRGLLVRLPERGVLVSQTSWAGHLPDPPAVGIDRPICVIQVPEDLEPVPPTKDFASQSWNLQPILLVLVILQKPLKTSDVFLNRQPFSIFLVKLGVLDHLGRTS